MENGMSSGDELVTRCFEATSMTARSLLSKTEHRPTIAIVCGSGLAGIGDMLEECDSFEYRDIVNFPTTTVHGHAGKLLFGKLDTITVVVMQGRLHMYEGYSAHKVTFPIRVLKLLGVKVVVLMSAVGGLNAAYNVGDLVVLKDHINLPGLTASNPLSGHNDDRFGERFPSMSDAYDRHIRCLALKTATELGIENVREGVYISQTGPCYETVAESKLLRMLGGDVVGMSTLPEVIVARHCGMRVFCLATVTNKCVVDYDSENRASHEEVLATITRRSKIVRQFIARLVTDIQL